ncbi:MAG: hypothetical protein ACK4OJ_07080, partial [Brevundimonas sp.]
MTKTTPHPSRFACHLLLQGEKAWSRRTVLASGLALPLAACDSTSAEPTPPNAPPLKSVAPCPFGTAIKAIQIDDPDWVALARANVSQLTPEWEMKMEYVLADGLDRPRFDRTDRIAAFAARGEDISNAMPPGGQWMDRSNPRVAMLMEQQKQMNVTMGQM